MKYFSIYFALFILGGVMVLPGKNDQAKLYEIYGFVQDASTGKPLPSANIRVQKTGLGTVSNEQGKFYLLLPSGEFRIIVEYLGYRSDTVIVKPHLRKKPLEVKLTPVAYSLPPITVVAEQFNPAEQVILNAIRKKRRWLSALKNYRFQAYTKTVFRVVKTKDSRKDTIIVGLTEVQTVGQYQAPDHYREEIIARRQTSNLSPTNNIFTSGRIPNLNEDIITIGVNKIIGPTHPQALQYYSFEMIDTLSLDQKPVYVIKMTPKNRIIPLLQGTIMIMDSTYQIVGMNVGSNKAADFSPLRDVRIQGKFACYRDSFYLPISVHTTARFDLNIPGIPPVFMEQVTVLSDYQVNLPSESLMFDKYYLTVDPMADQRDSLYWKLQQKIPLTREEAHSYQEIDSIMASRNFINKSIIWLLQLPFKYQKWPITSIFDFYHFNRIEGHYAGMGLKWNGDESLWRISVRTGYGFADRLWKYEISIARRMPDRNDFEISPEINIYRKLESRGQKQPFGKGLVTYGCWTKKKDYYDYYLRDGYSAGVSVSLPANITSRIIFVKEKQRSVVVNSDFALLYKHRRYRENPAILPGNFVGLQFSMIFDNRKFIKLGFFETPVTDRNNWVVEFMGTTSPNKWFKSDFDFWRFQLQIRRHQLTFWSGFLDAQLFVGQSGGKLPPQKQFELPAAFDSYAPWGLFKTISPTSYRGDYLWMLILEHHFGQWPLMWIPYIKKLNLDFLILMNIGRTGFHRPSQFKNVLYSQKLREPLLEVGFGFSRLLSFLKLDFTWQLRPQYDFAVTIGRSF